MSTQPRANAVHLLSVLAAAALLLLAPTFTTASRLHFRGAATAVTPMDNAEDIIAAAESLANHRAATRSGLEELAADELLARSASEKGNANSRLHRKEGGAGGGVNPHASVELSAATDDDDDDDEESSKLPWHADKRQHDKEDKHDKEEEQEQKTADDASKSQTDAVIKPRHHAVSHTASNSARSRASSSARSTSNRERQPADDRDHNDNDDDDDDEEEEDDDDDVSSEQQVRTTSAGSSRSSTHPRAAGLAARLAKAKAALQAAKAARDARTAIGEDSAIAAVVAAASTAEATADDGDEGTADGFLVGATRSSASSLNRRKDSKSDAYRKSGGVTAKDSREANAEGDEEVEESQEEVSADPFAQDSLPVVLWHGMGDSCCATWSIGAIADTIRQKLGVYVHSIATGMGTTHDILSSYFGDVNDQVAAVCQELRTIPELKNGFNAVGFSQGGQFMRAVVQRCQHTFQGPGVVNLITLGAQHQGVMNIPGCAAVPTNSSFATCKVMQRLLAQGAYLPYVRDHVVQAQYFKDPSRLEQYMASNPFLPDINNEHPSKSTIYKDNLATLQSLVLYRFKEDDTVVPRDSAWFFFYDGQQLRTLKELDIYTEDWIGLKTLDEGHRLIFAEAPGAHMQFTLQWFEDEIIDKYLAGPPPSRASSIEALSVE